MKTVTAEQIRSDFTEIANNVRYKKETYVLTRHNKPCVGIVPLELLNMISAVLNKATQNKQIAKLVEEYVSIIEPEDYEFLMQWSDNPPELSKDLKAAAKSLKGKIIF